MSTVPLQAVAVVCIDSANAAPLEALPVPGGPFVLSEIFVKLSYSGIVNEFKKQIAYFVVFTCFA